MFFLSFLANVIIVKILIDCGADVNHKNKKRKTPLHLACKKGAEEKSSMNQHFW